MAKLVACPKECSRWLLGETDGLITLSKSKRR